jgi:hypothetical protein
MLYLKKDIIKSVSIIDVLFIIVLVKETLWSYFGIVLSKIPIIGLISNEITTIFILCLVLLSASNFIKILKPIDYIICSAFLVIYLLQYIIFPQNTDFLEEGIVKFLFYSLPLYFIGRTIDFEKLSNIITFLSILSILTITFTSFYYKGGDDFGGAYGGYHMNLSFKLLPFVLLTLLDAFNNKRMISIALAIYGFILLLSLGNRSCIVYLTICFLYFFVYSLKAISNLKKFIIVIIVPFIIYLFYDLIFENLYSIVSEKGVTARIFTSIEDDRFFEDSGRFNIFKNIFSSLSSNPFGLGFFGDRILTGIYSHNIFVEILSSFGYFIGSFLIVGLLIVLFKAYKYSFENNHLFFIALVGFCLLPLMTSGSFIEYPYFYFLLGYCIKLIVSKATFLYKRHKYVDNI